MERIPEPAPINPGHLRRMTALASEKTRYCPPPRHGPPRAWPVTYPLGDWETYWGAGFGFTICTNGEDDTPPETTYDLGDCPRDLSAIQGVRFRVSGNIPDQGIQVEFNESTRDVDARIDLPSTGTYIALIEDAYVPSAPTAVVDPDDIFSINFSVIGVPDVDPVQLLRLRFENRDRLIRL